MANRRNTTDSGPDPMMLFVIISTILVVATMIAFLVLIVISVNSTPSATSKQYGPYNVAQRPVPSVPDPSRLLPPTLGDFKRTKISGAAQDYKGTYESAANQIVLIISEGVSVRAAQAYVSIAAQSDKDAKLTNTVLDRDPSYFVSTHKDLPSIRLVWSHDRWFFDLTANSQQALDAFMKVFKY